MKICVWSDLHLGRTLYRTNPGELNKFEAIGYRTFNEYIDVILKENPNILINLGDTFETSNPSIVALTKFAEGMNRLKDIPQLAILGNHDFSHKNRTEDCSSVETFFKTTDCNILKFADYNVEYYVEDDCLFVLLPYVYDSIDNIVRMYMQVEEIVKNNKQKRNFLLTHGVTQQYAKNFPGFENEHINISDNLLANFDMCLIGHIHMPLDYKVGKCRVISPGAMINWVEPVDDTGPLFIDTNTLKLNRVHIDTVHTIKENADETNVNDILKDVDENIYKISYTGDTSIIDNSLFIEAKNKAVNLILDIQRFDKDEDLNANTEQANIKDFSAWIKDNYPDKEKIFSEAKANISEN